MSSTKIASLPDRGVISVAGGDAVKFLQGLLTNDVELAADGKAMFAALLSPQGKILADFFVTRHGGRLLLECPRILASDLVKRLRMYKLRAAVDVADVSDDYSVLALWGEAPASSGQTAATLSFHDPRLPALGQRILAECRHARDIAAATNGADAAPEDYHRHRIALGVPEGGRDFAFSDAFPHEAMMDLLNGISFTKGCYVGQEIVARMQHRGTARKRIVKVIGKSTLQTGAEVLAGDVVVGTVGSVSDSRGLVMIRLDRAAELAAKGMMLTAGGADVEIEVPIWARAAVSAVAAV